MDSIANGRWQHPSREVEIVYSLNSIHSCNWVKYFGPKEKVRTKQKFHFHIYYALALFRYHCFPRWTMTYCCPNRKWYKSPKIPNWKMFNSTNEKKKSFNCCHTLGNKWSRTRNVNYMTCNAVSLKLSGHWSMRNYQSNRTVRYEKNNEKTQPFNRDFSRT